MYKCEYFKIEELVPMKIFETTSEKILWRIFDDRALKTLDAFRNTFGVTIVNNWHKDGEFQYSGFRPENCAIGKWYSQHRFCRAFDCKFKDYDAEDVRKTLLSMSNQELFDKGFLWPFRLEDDVSWVHFDMVNMNDSIYLFHA